MAETLYSVVGTANHDGVIKLHWGKDLIRRVKSLSDKGATDIRLDELPYPMLKLDALEYLSSQQLDEQFAYLVEMKLAEKKIQAHKQQRKLTVTSGKSKVEKTTEEA